MSRTAARLTPSPSPEASPKPRAAKPPERPKESWRDTIEQVVVALILAILIRGFEAEAFVIPTGSMAPTLMGRHKEVDCPQCGHRYAVGASEEVEGFMPGLNPRLRRVDAGVCNNCRFTATGLAGQVSYNGDRILVEKFPYDLPMLPGAGPPRRWDVVVFKYPEEPETNYIKRLVGLPGETLRIHFGDILARPPGEGEFRLARKPLDHQRSMQMLVYDDAHRPKALADKPEWARWRHPADSWKETTPGTFEAGPRAGPLSYRNLVPDPAQWDAALEGQAQPHPPRASLITDFYAYNTGQLAGRGDADGAWIQPHWVGDLTLAFRLDVKEPDGVARVRLAEGGVDHECAIDLKTGLATLSRAGKALGEARPTGIDGGGSFEVRFANVDNRLTLWVDGATPFGDGLTYDDAGAERPAPTEADLAPASIDPGGAEIAVSGLVLTRDIYYTQVPGQFDYDGIWDVRMPRTAAELLDFLSDPARFPALGKLDAREYPIGPDRFMMMGDNSPKSKDGRGWGTRDRVDVDRPGGWDETGRAYWETPRSLLIGKAFFVYWPHGRPFGPDIRLSPDLRVPFRPYVERMKLIR